MHSWPYQNDHIITTIRELFFESGTTSFAMHFEALFIQTHDGGPVTREVPMSMVSLVATGASQNQV